MVGKKKRGHPDLEELLARPWCYYCERDFDDLKILISHQKAKHFKCERCSRRLNTAGGLSVHMNQVHKESLTCVENAINQDRAGLDVEIFGMEGIPEDIKQRHNQGIIEGYYAAEAARRAATGNHGAHGGGPNPSKKPKFESPSDLKARLAAHKARKAELAANGGVSSGDATPNAGVPNSQSPALPAPGLSPSFANSPYAPPQVPYGAPPPAAGYGFAPETYGQGPPAAFAPPYQQPPFAGPGAPYVPPPAPYGAAPPYAPQPSFSPAPYQQAPFGAPPPQYGAGTPPVFNAYAPPPHPPGPPGSLPARPTPPGLPSRPSFSGPPGGPPGAQFPMHQGSPQQGGWGQNGWNGPDHHNPAMSSAYPPHNQGYNDGHAANASNGVSKEPDDIDEMIRQAELGIKPVKKNDSNPPPTQAPPAQAPLAQAPTPAPSVKKDSTPEVTEKKSKKAKEIPKMVYHDEEVSPEEKMAKLPRYAFVPEKKDETILVDATQVPGVAGTVDN